MWLARRTANVSARPGLLECAGGAVREGEDPSKAAVREVREETALAIEPERLVWHGILELADLRLWLYRVELGRCERPKDTEPTKRNAWQLCNPVRLKPSRYTPGLVALVGAFADVVRANKEGV